MLRYIHLNKKYSVSLKWAAMENFIQTVHLPAIQMLRQSKHLFHKCWLIRELLLHGDLIYLTPADLLWRPDLLTETHGTELSSLS